MCSVCHGHGKVQKEHTIAIEVQRGAVSGASRTYTLTDGSKAQFTIHQKPHREFTRQGDDLYVKRRISLKEALLGTDLSIRTITGKVISVHIPAGVQPFETIKVRNHGFIRDPTGLTNKLKSVVFPRGNLYISVDIDFPSILTKSQKEIIEEIL